MKLSELIQKLERIKINNGDLEVCNIQYSPFNKCQRMDDSEIKIQYITKDRKLSDRKTKTKIITIE